MRLLISQPVVAAAVLGLFAVFAGPDTARADAVADGGDLQRFYPAAAPWAGLGAGSAETMDQGKWTAALLLNYARNPLVTWDDGTRIWSTVQNNLTVHVGGSFGVFDWLTVEGQLPVVAYQNGNDPQYPTLAGPIIGDLRLTPRFRVYTQWKDGFAVSLAPTITIPFGGDRILAGDPGPTLVPEASFSYRAKAWAMASQVSGRVRPDLNVVAKTQLGSELMFRVAGSAAVTKMVEAVVDLNAGLAFATLGNGSVGNPMEIMGGARIRPEEEWTITLGVGTALLAAPGTPDIRVVAGAIYGTGLTPPGTAACVRVDDSDAKQTLRGLGTDVDGDGLDDVCDRCAEAAETVNGYQDEDGCPESDPDNDKIYDPNDACPNDAGPAPTGCPDIDGDGILDKADECPTIAGLSPTGCPDTDGDGLLDRDDQCPDEKGDRPTGCPDADGDGLLDRDDKCPAEAEDKDGFEDENGCPEADNDMDGILDAADRCPLVPEDRDGFMDEDGCPDPDNDADGITDDKDKCPNEQEVINGFEDEDGCPDSKGKVLVVVKKDRIEILDKVFFKTNSDVIEKKSFGLLDQVALTIQAHAEIPKIRVEGHTDDVGGRVKNLDLSQRRADSVRKYLEKKGVLKDRLVSEGFAFDRPIVPNDSEKNRATNRRVEFMIVPDAPPAEAPATDELPPPPPMPVP